jgi:hypothetical protein
MKKTITLSGLLLLTACMFSFDSFAQIETRRVSIPSGKTSTTIKSSLKGDKTIDYLINAQQGQTLSVNLTTTNGANYFNVLAPGSDDVSVFTGSSDGNNYKGVLTASGDWKIRVYLMRSAARRNESANFTLQISVTGSSGAASTDAKVSGTKYNATGQVKAYLGNSTSPVDADFGVIRKGNGNAEIHLTVPNSLTHKIQFADNKWSSLDGSSIKAQRINPDEWRVTVGDYTSYIIFNAIIYGG